MFDECGVNRKRNGKVVWVWEKFIYIAKNELIPITLVNLASLSRETNYSKALYSISTPQKP